VSTSPPQTLTAKGAVAVGRLVAEGVVRAVDVLDAHLERIAAVDPALGAVVALDEAGARAAAEGVDRAVAAGRPLPPLAGVPTTVKEAFAVRGLPTTAGMPGRPPIPAPDDAPAVAALRHAGAVILGVTNVPTQLADLHCANPLHGPTVNPWDPRRTPGGSSGGSAAALAAGLSALELGSDLSGSIRVPASWCGVVGLRPTHGQISKRGHLPWPLDGLLEPPVSVVGPMARSVADVAAAFAVLTGRPPPGRQPPPGRRRIGLWLGAAGAPVDSETTGQLTATADRLSAAGIDVVAVSPPIDPEAAVALAWRLVDAEIARGLTPAQWEEARAAGSPTLAVLLRHHYDDLEAGLRLTAAWAPVWAEVDAVLCPATPVVAQPLDDRPGLTFVDRPLHVDGDTHPGRALAAWSLLTSGAQLPSVTLPVGLGAATGLPVGAQLVGRPGGDAHLLAVAAEVEAALGPMPGSRDEVLTRR
jgi:amidase